MKINRYLILFSGFLLYSLASVVAKSSAGHPLLSGTSILRFFLVLIILGSYAALWQISLKMSKLSMAYMCRGSLVILAMLWANLLFHETITRNNVIGALLVISGIIMFAYNSKPEL